MALVTKGKTFANGELVTPAKIHALVDSATVTNIVNADIDAAAAIADTKLATISSSGKVANSATTATSANTANAIVTRDGSGNFSAGNITGNASTATKLATARTISLTGDVSGSATFDGSANASITATVADDSHNHTIANVDGLKDALDGKQAAGSYAPASHTHAATNITSGTLAIARIPTGTTSSTVCIGNDTRLVPPGAIMPFAMTTAPSGWLAANGNAVSRTTYSALFAVIGTTYGSGNGSSTFNLPDLRGYFVRGFGTNSDGVVSGTFGVKQSDAFQGHVHAETFIFQTSAVAGGFGGSGNPLQSTQKSGSPETDNINGTPRIASETRPANIALRYCIKT